MYYNYHKIAQTKIKNGMLKKFEYTEKWINIKPALVLYFSDNKIMPIRQERWFEYQFLIEKHYQNKSEK